MPRSRAAFPSYSPAVRLRLALRLAAALPPRGPRAGFTLIELLVVVVIIGILASVAGPGYIKAMERARNANVKSVAKNVQVSIENFASQNNGGMPHPTGWLLATDTSGIPTMRQAGVLRGGKLPESPWGGIQTQFILPPTDLPKANQLESEASTVVLPAPGYDLGPGRVRAAGPAATTDFGAYIYDSTTNNGAGNFGSTYVIYGVGKRGRQAVLTSAASNTGR